jgi:GrpB-like predicted nucleotidyltransferase (UPF0157 family)
LGKITVVDYDPSWPRLFDTLSSAVHLAVADLAISIEHIGSTAVPGLAAKPVIDMDVVVHARDVQAGIARLGTLGYEHLGDWGIPTREAFRPPPGLPFHHLYLCPSTSPALANHLAVRDYLRGNRAEAKAYGDLKRRLAVEYADDRDGYVQAKTAFLIAILRKCGFAEDILVGIERANHRPAAAR